MKFLFLVLLAVSALPVKTFSATCATPVVVTSPCCNYTFPEGSKSATTNYKSPQSVFSDETAARNWVNTLAAKMPFYIPNEPGSSLVQGWLYNDGTGHGAFDYWKTSVKAKEDAAINVRATAPGKIVAKFWNNWFGNTLVIEHKAPDGSKYRSLYMHLRDGLNHDLKAARALVPSNPKAKDPWTRYLKFAKKNSSKLYWGTSDHTISVKVGDAVKAGQYLAKSGNTGVGGIGLVLKDDGTLSDPVRANNHLQFMLAVPNPNTAGEWVFIDPFGVYNQANSGCYEPMKEIELPRFIAPFQQNFSNVSWDYLKSNFNYYPKMGMGLQTLSLYLVNNKIRAAGVFQEGVSTAPAMQTNLSVGEFGNWYNTYLQQGLRPREIQVFTDMDGQPRFSVIWQARGDENYVLLLNINDEELIGKWNDLILNQGYRVEDHLSYTVGGERRHTLAVMKDNQPFQLWFNLTAQEYTDKYYEVGLLGWKNTTFNAAELPWGERYGGVWMMKPGSWVTKYNMDPTQYQQKYDELSGQGYKIWRIQGYAEGSRFGAIWVKP